MNDEGVMSLFVQRCDKYGRDGKMNRSFNIWKVLRELYTFMINTTGTEVLLRLIQ